jgi:AcrR family transcriptional regulator
VTGAGALFNAPRHAHLLTFRPPATGDEHPPMTQPNQASSRTSRFTEKREALLSTAALLFNERGVKGATLSDVAATVGLVKNSVTYYYRKKEDLATACFVRAIAVYGELAEQAAKRPTVAERVHELFRQLALRLVAIEAGQQPMLILFNDLRALPHPQVDEVFTAYTQMFRRVRSLLKGPETAGLSREELNARGHILLSLLNGLRTFVQRHEAHEYGRIAERAADIVLHGMAGRAAGWVGAGAEAAWHLDSQSDMAPGSFLRSATELINELGYRGASVTKISDRLNVTKGAFYYHNDNKDDLVTQCFGHTFGIVRQALSLSQATPGTAWDHLCMTARGLVRYQLSAAGPLLRLTAISALTDPAHRARITEATNRLTERMTNLIVDGVMNASIRPLDASLAAQIALNGINAAAELRRWSPHADVDNAAQLYARPLLLGLLQPR